VDCVVLGWGGRGQPGRYNALALVCSRLPALYKKRAPRSRDHAPKFAILGKRIWSERERAPGLTDLALSEIEVDLGVVAPFSHGPVASQPTSSCA
jgi:hypothetical protein